MTLSTDITAGLADAAVGLERVDIRPGALADLPQVVSGARRIAYLIDEDTYRTRDDADLKSTVRSVLETVADVVPVVLGGHVHADEVTVQSAVNGCANADVVVTFGSGTLSDIGKVAAAASGARHVIVQSAASVNGFADDQSVLLIKGVKRTSHSAWPKALVVDVDVVAQAPVQLNASGLGDMISMFTAPADWYLAMQFDMDRGWNAEAATMTRRHGERLLDIAGALRVGDSAAVQSLSEFVTLSGLSMGIAGQTSPSSGMEHTVSHMLDMAQGARGRNTALHGSQVGVATVAVSLLWRRMRRRLADAAIGEFRVMADDEARERVVAAFGWMDADGATAEECWNDYRKKLDALRALPADRLERMQAEWSRHSAALDDLLESPERIVEALRAAGAPIRFSELDSPSDSETVAWALSSCHLMRNRFTIADLAFATGAWGPDDVADVLEEARALGSGA